MRKRCHDTIGVAAELGDDSNPALRPSFAEEALSAGSWVWFTVVRCLDRVHRLCKVLAHLDMLVNHMIPRYVVHLHEMALRVANLGDDVTLRDPPRLRVSADEVGVDRLVIVSEFEHSATMTHMELVGIREMRQNLSRYAQRVKHGESFLITDRGQQIAQLTPAPGRATVIDRLVGERGARRGRGTLLDLLPELSEPIPGPPSDQVLNELRSERQ